MAWCGIASLAARRLPVAHALLGQRAVPCTYIQIAHRHQHGLCNLAAKLLAEKVVSAAEDSGDLTEAQQDGTATTIPPLRDYQIEAIENILESYQQQGFTRMLVSMPTGSGKTRMFCHLAKQLGKKTLVLSNREELVGQTVETFKAVWPESEPGIVQARRNQYTRYVVVATVQTACGVKRYEQLREQNFELLIIDEAHHSTTASYQAVYEALGFNQADPNKLMIGVTATPYRSDHGRQNVQNLKDVYEHIPFQITIGELIEAGWLSKVQAQRINTFLDLSDIKVDTDSPGEADFSLPELTKVIDTAERNALVVASYQKFAEGRRAVAFCCSIEHAEHVAEAFRANGVAAACIHSKLLTQERRALLERHQTGDLQVLTNVGILTEGYDDSAISCILMTRPTKSTGLYVQCVGRGLRPHSGKEDCLVLDFTDRYHVLNRESDLVTAPVALGEGAGMQFHGYNNPTGGIVKELKQVLQSGSISLFATQKYAWVPVRGRHYLNCFNPQGFTGLIRLQRCPQNPGERKSSFKQWQLSRTDDAWGPWHEEDWTPIAEPINGRNDAHALLRAEQLLQNSKYRSSLSTATLASRSRELEPSEKQLQLLKDLGVLQEPELKDLEAAQELPKLTRGAVSDLINMAKLERAHMQALGQYKPNELLPASEAQRRYIQSLLREQTRPEDQPEKDKLLKGVDTENIDKIQASAVINGLKRLIKRFEHNNACIDVSAVSPPLMLGGGSDNASTQ